MDISDVRRLLAYDQWANQQLMSAALHLPPGHFMQDLGASFGSIKGTLTHILVGEWHWLQFWQGKPRTKRAASETFADAAALAAGFLELNQELRAFAESVTDDRLRASLRIKERAYPLDTLIQHAVNHSTYHRGQVATLFRQLDQKPPATDFRVFLDFAVGQDVPSGTVTPSQPAS